MPASPGPGRCRAPVDCRTGGGVTRHGLAATCGRTGSAAWRQAPPELALARPLRCLGRTPPLRALMRPPANRTHGVERRSPASRDVLAGAGSRGFRSRLTLPAWTVAGSGARAEHARTRSSTGPCPPPALWPDLKWPAPHGAYGREHRIDMRTAALEADPLRRRAGAPIRRHRHDRTMPSVSIVRRQRARPACRVRGCARRRVRSPHSHLEIR